MTGASPDVRGSSGGASTESSSVVHAPQPLALRGIFDVADEVVEAVAHRSSSSSRSARRASALRVRVLTVPSGTFRNAEISLCESPPQ